MRNIKTIFISLIFLFTFVNSGSKGQPSVKPVLQESPSDIVRLNNSLKSVIEEYHTLQVKNDSLRDIKLNLKTQ